VVMDLQELEVMRVVSVVPVAVDLQVVLYI
jgi:hypothetical protein